MAAEAAMESAPEAVSEGRSDRLKNLALLGLVALVLVLVYYFFVVPQTMFVPGSQLDAEQFKDIFASAGNVYILMDVRGVRDNATSNNILQCGVDFASSSGMGGKTVTPLSAGDVEGCIGPDGAHPMSYCFSQLRNGIAIYVHAGSGASYYTNGMTVGVGQNYTTGTCGIRRV